MQAEDHLQHDQPSQELVRLMQRSLIQPQRFLVLPSVAPFPRQVQRRPTRTGIWSRSSRSGTVALAGRGIAFGRFLVSPGRGKPVRGLRLHTIAQMEMHEHSTAGKQGSSSPQHRPPEPAAAEPHAGQGAALQTHMDLFHQLPGTAVLLDVRFWGASKGEGAVGKW